MDFSFFRTARPFLIGSFAAGLIAGCEEWPRYKNKTAIDGEALEPGTDPASGVALEWTSSREEDEPNDAPNDGPALSVGDGLLISGSLDGLGWNPDASADRVSECGNSLAFPPSTPGDYTGDVDWITISPSEPAMLCLDLLTEHPEARLDAALYTLDECGEAVGVFVHPNTNDPIGTNVAASHVRWAVAVDESVKLAIGLAGFWPDDDALIIDWTAAVSLVPSVAGAADALCPEAP